MFENCSKGVLRPGLKQGIVQVDPFAPTETNPVDRVDRVRFSFEQVAILVCCQADIGAITLYDQGERFGLRKWQSGDGVKGMLLHSCHSLEAPASGEPSRRVKLADLPSITTRKSSSE